MQQQEREAEDVVTPSGHQEKGEGGGREVRIATEDTPPPALIDAAK